jgi:hypothetical protein
MAVDSSALEYLPFTMMSDPLVHVRGNAVYPAGQSDTHFTPEAVG